MSVLSDTIFTIPGYRITEQIYSGSQTLVYRGIREQDQKSVILKLMRNENPTFGEIAQFRNQYTITKNLDIPGIAKPLSLENYGHRDVLVIEDFGGISLQRLGTWQKSPIRKWHHAHRVFSDRYRNSIDPRGTTSRSHHS